MLKIAPTRLATAVTTLTHTVPACYVRPNAQPAYVLTDGGAGGYTDNAS